MSDEDELLLLSAAASAATIALAACIVKEENGLNDVGCCQEYGRQYSRASTSAVNNFDYVTSGTSSQWIT